jgi:hypothetical protein
MNLATERIWNGRTFGDHFMTILNDDYASILYDHEDGFIVDGWAKTARLYKFYLMLNFDPIPFMTSKRLKLSQAELDFRARVSPKALVDYMLFTFVNPLRIVWTRYEHEAGYNFLTCAHVCDLAMVFFDHSSPALFDPDNPLFDIGNPKILTQFLQEYANDPYKLIARLLQFKNAAANIDKIY